MPDEPSNPAASGPTPGENPSADGSPSPELRERARKAEKIIASPAAYKICEACDSIVSARVSTCPNCHSYRFDGSPEAVILQARLLASRPQASVLEGDLF